MVPVMGVIMHKAFQLPSHIRGYETIGMGIHFNVAGGQGGRINYPQDVVSSSPKLGLSWMNESFGTMMVKLWLALLFFSLHEVWFSFMPRGGMLSTWVCSIITFFFIGGLVYL